MHRLRLAIPFVLLSLPGARWGAAAPAGPAPLATLRKEHPRLILTDERLRELKALHASDKLLQRYVRDALDGADRLLGAKALQYEIPDGLRLLAVSRACVDRVSTLAFAHRWTGERKYADAALRDLRAVCAFKDWNPRHFLDTAEMANGVGIGYDWLFKALDDGEKKTIREALIRLGLQPGRAAYEKGAYWFPKAEHNWNQVCNMGLIVGALAIADEEADLAAAVVSGALESLPRAMANYAPDGAWMEGPGYWNYATSYTCFGLAALDTALGKDFGIGASPGFSESGAFPIYGSGPTGLYLSFADAGMMSRRRPQACLMHLAYKYKRADFADAEHETLENGRASAFHVAWYVPPSGRAAARDLDRYFRGPVEVVTMRTAWGDPDALWVGAKAGFNTVNHGHLDLGNFELDALGVRWAVDLGSDNYNLPGYWDGKEGGKRWSYYRLGSHSHNIVTIGGKHQLVAGTARVVKWATTPEAGAAVIELVKAYADASRVFRGVQLLRREQVVLVQDEIALNGTQDLTWGMTTEANIQLENGAAILSQDKKRLRVKVLAPEGAKFESGSAERAKPEKDNQGFKRLMLTLRGASGEQRIAVLFQPLPQDRPAPSIAVRPLASWSAAGASAASKPASAGVATPAPKPEPAAARAPRPGAIEAWKERLKARLAEQVASGKGPRFAAFGTEVTVTALTPGGDLRVRMSGGGEAEVAWARIGNAEGLSLAQGLLREGMAADHALVAFYLLLNQRPAAAHLAMAGSLAKEVEGAFAD